MLEKEFNKILNQIKKLENLCTAYSTELEKERIAQEKIALARKLVQTSSYMIDQKKKKSKEDRARKKIFKTLDIK